jgi:cellulose synthase (UDP-forming)
MNPETVNKYVYVERTPTWLVRTVYGIGIVVWIPVLFGSIALVGKDPFFTWFVLPIICILSIHYLTSFTLNLFYRQFDIKEHDRLVEKFWVANKDPSVDIYLPICGEDMAILHNTWKYISRLEYKNKRVYVLDDSKEDREEHERWAKHYGFDYISRPNRGEMKKAGNLKYAYERTNGDFIAIFDADFAPRSDYLRELIPHMSDPHVGIVQSPQYFSTDPEIHKSSPLAYGGARAQEIFYRVMQVARDRLGGTHCCGTCAIYRRAALASIGGFVQMSHSEDAHTGLGIQKGGWTIRYIPLAVSIGISPDDPHAFLHQQHRWCLGNMLMLIDGEFWRAPISWKAKFCYITGFLFYLQQPFFILSSFELFWILFFYSKYISLSAGLLFYPDVIWAFSYMFFFYIAPFRWGYMYAILLRMYAYSHAIATVVLGGTVGWIATGSKHAGVSSAYRQTVIAVGGCLLIYMVGIAVLIKKGALNLLNYNDYSLDFWIFFNLALVVMLLWQMYRRMVRAQVRSSLPTWQLKTAGTYTALATALFFGIIYVPVPIKNNVSKTAIVAMATAPQAMQTTPSSTAFRFRTNEKVGEQGSDILALQQFLNDHGYTVSQTGPGSPGDETVYFGQSTRQALVEFQSANQLHADGYFGWETRDFINSNTVFAAAPITVAIANTTTTTTTILNTTDTIKTATASTTTKATAISPISISPSTPTTTPVAKATSTLSLTTSTKTVPYSLETFAKSEGWKDQWGSLLIATDSLAIGANDVGTSGGVLLSGTNAWTDYTFHTTLEWVKGEEFGLMARYQDPNDYAVCSFDEPSSGKVTITAEQYVNGKKIALASGEDLDTSLPNGVDINASIEVQGTTEICSFNNHVVSSLESGYQLNSPFRGGIGFTTWDSAINNSQIVIKSLSVANIN